MANKVVVVIAGENQAQKVFKGIHAGLGGIGRVGLSATQVLGGLTAALGVGALARFAKGLVDVQDEAGKSAQKLGVTTEFFTGLSYAAKISNVESVALSTGLRFLSKHLAEAQVTGSAAEATFRRVGVSVKDAAGQIRPTEQVLGDLADRFRSMPDGATKTALAIQLFGRAGSDLIPMLNEGRAGLDAMRAEAERLGLVIDDKTAAAADKLNDSLERMEGMAKGAASQFLSGFIPGIANAADEMSRLGTETDDFRQAGETLARWLVDAVTWFGGLALAIRQVPPELGKLASEMRLLNPLDRALFGSEIRGDIAQYSIEIKNLGDRYATLLKWADALNRKPSINDLFDPSRSFQSTLAALGIKPPTKPQAPPTGGGGAGAFAPAFTPATDLVTQAQLLEQIAQAIKLVNLAAGETGGAEKFLEILGSPLPTGWPDELKKLEAQIDVIFTNLATKTEEVQGLVSRGAISEIQGGQRIVDLHRQTGTELEALIPRYRELAALTGDPTMGAGVEALATRVKNLKSEVDVLGGHIKDVFVNDFANAVANIATGTQSIGDAFKSMAKSVIGELVRIIAKMLIMWVLSKLLGGIFGKGIGGGTLSIPGIGGKAQGGHFSAGQPFIAGEMGLPELIVPESAGTVISGGQFAAMQAGGGDTFIINAPGADIGVVQRLEALEQTLPQTVGASMRAMFEYQRRS